MELYLPLSHLRIDILSLEWTDQPRQYKDSSPETKAESKLNPSQISNYGKRENV